MPLQKLTREELALIELAQRVPAEYIAFMQRLLPGEGARVSVGSEGVSRAMIKQRINTVAEGLGMELEYLPAPRDIVAFMVLRITGNWAGRSGWSEGVTILTPKPAPAAGADAQDLAADLAEALEQ